MIAYLKGELLEADFNGCVVVAGGVGYLVQIPLSTFEKLPRPGETAELFIRTLVREDAIVLFGFVTREERALFDLLVSVNMVGGKLALAILGAMPVDTFCAAVRAGDIKMLSRIPGIGKRTAERLVVELRDKLGSISASAARLFAREQAASDLYEAVLWKKISRITADTLGRQAAFKEVTRKFLTV